MAWGIRGYMFYFWKVHVKFSAYSLDLKDLSKVHPLVTYFLSFFNYFKNLFYSFFIYMFYLFFFFFFKWFFKYLDENQDLFLISSNTCLIKVVGCYGMGMEEYLGYTTWIKSRFRREITKVIFNSNGLWDFQIKAKVNRNK